MKLSFQIGYRAIFWVLFIFSISLKVKAVTSLTVNSTGSAVNPMSYLNNAGHGGVAQRTTTNDFSIRLRGSCYATNLRGVANPISPDSILKISGKISVNNSAPADFSFQVPSRIVVGGGLAGSGSQNLSLATAVGFSNNARLAASGNMVLLKLLNADTAKLDPVTAKITQTKKIFSISDIRFDQVVTTTPSPPTYQEWQNYLQYAKARQNYTYDYASYSDQIVNRQFTAKNGPLSGSFSMTKSSDGKVVDITASFPGEAMFCGGYYSPLMVFFDEKRPTFDNITKFDMRTGLRTHWPEKNHPGYFIVLPKNGKVTSRDQLFGEQPEVKNGFLKLAKYDLNHDGVIDAKDPIFKKLFLWKDKLGLGVFRSQDAILLSSKIKSIRLNYNSQIEPVGAFAEFREKSDFEFYLKDSNLLQKGEIIDVWFKPAPKN